MTWEQFQQLDRDAQWVFGILGALALLTISFVIVFLLNGSTLRVIPAVMKAAPFFLPNIIAAMVAAIAVIVGGFGPWVTILVFSKPGVGGDGAVTAGLGGVALVCLFTVANLARTRVESGWLVLLSLVAFGAGTLAFVVAVIDANALMGGGSIELFDRVIGPELGWGIWMTLIASAVLMLTSFVVTIVVRTTMNRAYPDW